MQYPQKTFAVLIKEPMFEPSGLLNWRVDFILF